MEPLKRNACRALLVSPEQRILLIQVSEPNGWSGWITPGGGLEAGESPEQGLARELREELSFELRRPSPPVWRRTHTFIWADRQIEQSELYFYVPTEEAFLPSGESLAFKWWPIQDLLESQEVFAPRRLGPLLMELLQSGPPASPIDVGA